MTEQIVKHAEERMEKAVAAFRKDAASIRAGRATPAMLEKVTVEYYGSQMPIPQVASVTSPEPRLLVISPWEKSMLSEIEKAIQKSDLGLNPANDGSVIRLVIPALTEQRRQELVKQVKKMAEEARVAIRNVRRDANDELKKAEKNGDASEDDVRRLMERIQQLTDKFVGEIDKAATGKEQELLEV
ncbi:ribosome recycling factor [Alicyclobacillus tolerans]|uniref:Ribosome-recycling factor n=2 Tax=Alicyclobacillus tolerans TaxID=90970 RepID=A0ABT9LX78_9BACL|nr:MULTISPECIES: ribosome recycling factor [Alicyclobacillus]MDP9728874.1 ribosome recycling factor [Alicyclobacillus tengchongensis]QRF23694.1 ribosome recycling factor [Alicyclobacillus sp. TC]SHK33256.1 ribosome recycling factor [Alicyclobacillus montanus]